MAARRILTLAVLGTMVASAYASPRTDPTQGRAVFTGAAAANPTSVSLSPAALGLVQATQIYAALLSTLTHTSVDLREADGAVSDTSAAPGAVFAVVWKGSDRIRLGFEARLPPRERQLEGYDELRYFTLGGSHQTLSTSLAVNIKLSNSFFVGAALSHENSWVRLKFARDAALATGDAANVGNPDAAEYYDVDVRSSYVSASNLKVTLGLMVKLAQDVWLAAAYHTPPGLSLQTSIDGTIDATKAPLDGGAMVRGGSTVTFSQPANVDLQLRARVLPTLDANIGGRWEDTSRFSAYDVRGYGATYGRNSFPEGQLRARGFHDSFALWGGVEQVDHGERLRLGGRLGFETAALRNDRTSPMTMWPHSLTLDAGAQFRFQEGAPLVLQLTYGLQYFPDIEVTNGAYDPQDRLDCIDSGFDYSTPGCAATRNGYAIGSSSGTYGKLEHAARIGVRLDYD